MLRLGAKGAATLAVGLTLSAHPQAVADASLLDANDVEVALSIRRSLNRNRVDYGVRVNGGCDPVGSAPVLPYWRLLESGAGLEPLSGIERRAYGIASQTVRRRTGGSVIELRLRALRDRPIVVRTRRGPNGCEADAVLRIAGLDAVVRDIYVVVDGAVRVNRIELRGDALDGGNEVKETLRR